MFLSMLLLSIETTSRPEESIQVPEQTQAELGHLPSSLCVHLSVATSCYFSLAAPAVSSAELMEIQWRCQVNFYDSKRVPVLPQEM